MIEKLETGYTADIGKKPNGERNLIHLKDDAKTLKINELVDQSNRQDEAIKQIAFDFSSNQTVGAYGRVVDILSPNQSK